MPDRSLFRVLATSILAGEPVAAGIIQRLNRTLGKPWRWIPGLAQRYVEAFGAGIAPRKSEVVGFLLRDPVFPKYAHRIAIAEWLTEPRAIQSSGWNVPPIASTGALADWLLLTPRELDWFADLKNLACKTNAPQLRHYHYRILEKRSGGLRLIEAPKTLLKQLQRQILDEILNHIPAHPASHGFVAGRSIQSFVAPHAGQRVVLRMDLQDFFPSVSAARIQALFRTMGYPESLANALGGLCTSATPRKVWLAARAHRDILALYSRRHLPQGAPTSPALANLCAYQLDCRLARLAESAGGHYTRYADDLAFSGGERFERQVERFSTLVAVIASEERLRVNHHKTRVMKQGVRQHLAGLVVNRRANITRTDFDALKATLTNCVRSGPESQNRSAHHSFRAHLEGRVAFVASVHPERGGRLRAIFEQIDWNIIPSKS